MRSCLVLGTGRSGTSLVTGLLTRAGWFAGDHAWRARAANPHGFFETPEINGINEALLAPVLPARPELLAGQRWLGVPERPVAERVSPDLGARMRGALARGPFALKDPRFSFTLPAWRPFVGDAAFVAVFRHPAATAASMLEEVASAAYLRGLELDVPHVLEVWTAAYRAILERHTERGDWLFLHYDQALAPEGHAALGAFLGAKIDGAFADPKLRRAEPELEVPAEAMELYRELCERAGHRPDAQARPPKVPVTVVAVVGRGEEGRVSEVACDARAQRGVRTELVLVDATDNGLGTPPAGARVVRAPSASRGAAWRAGIDAAAHEIVALQRPGCRAMPSRLAHAVEALASGGHDLVTCDYWLEDDEGQFVGRSNPSLMGDAPGPFWESGLVGRRSALAEMETTAFRPVELELLRRAGARGRVGHVEEPGFGVPRTDYAEAWDGSRIDGALVTLAERPIEAGRPELTVSLCTYDRPDVFLESLESFCRQTVPPGTFELVVVDDGDPAGTRALLERLDLPIPCTYLRGPGRGLAAARNAGLARSRGRYVLFVNDDTIALPDLVEEHLRAHARLGEPVCVQGTFEQPPEAMRNALLRYLETSGEVFGFAGMRPGEWHGPFQFYTCNVSAPAEAVRRAGGFDESFRSYGCEDTDLGVRLAEIGCRVLYDDRARAWHRHAMDFDYLEKRQRAVAQAYVRFFRKHPRLLAEWKSERLRGAWVAERLAETRDDVRRTAAAARELAAIDVGALENLSGDYAATAKEVLEALAEAIPRLDEAWWREGYLAGFEEHGLSGFDELTEDGTERWPVSTDAARRVLAFPRWDDPAALERLLALAKPLAGADDVALVLRFDGGAGVPREEALARLQAAYERCFPGGEALEVVLEEAELPRSDLRRLGASVHAVLATGDEDAATLDLVVAERLTSVDAVAAWNGRFTGFADPEAAAPGGRRDGDFAPRLEATVIVPTRDRARELLQLLERLADQDLEPGRFDVIVVDDGSREPVESTLSARAWPFVLDVLRQTPAGPAAARNEALRRARGEIVVFFNDDAVPARDALRRHLETHRAASRPIAVQGTFRLLRRHLTDSFAHYVETSTALFAQPAMQPGVLYDGLALCTGNASVPRALLERAGGFDEAFPWAGGEDSELGLRLEREEGARVLYDPRVRCEHDHALDVRGFERRKRAVGWSAWRIFARHGTAGVMGPDARPDDEAWWSSLARRTAEGAPRVDRLVDEIAAVCEGERRNGIAPGTLAALRPALDRIGEHAFHVGLLAAREGREPFGGAPPSPPAALPSARPSADAPADARGAPR